MGSPPRCPREGFCTLLLSACKAVSVSPGRRPGARHPTKDPALKGPFASIPYVPFVPFDLVPPQPVPDLVLEGPFRVVGRLALDVGPHRLDVRLTHGKHCVPRLPVKRHDDPGM